MKKKDLKIAAKFIKTEEHGLVMPIKWFNELIDQVEKNQDINADLKRALNQRRQANKS